MKEIYNNKLSLTESTLNDGSYYLHPALDGNGNYFPIKDLLTDFEENLKFNDLVKVNGIIYSVSGFNYTMNFPYFRVI
jgi:hypothetical protein